MFAYNYMITTVRALTQELDNFTAELATAIEHKYVDNRSVSEEGADALRELFPERMTRQDAPTLRPERRPAAAQVEQEAEMALAGV